MVVMLKPIPSLLLRKVWSISKRKIMKWLLSILLVVTNKKVNCSMKWNKFKLLLILMNVFSLWTVQSVRLVTIKLRLSEMLLMSVVLLSLSSMVTLRVVVLWVLSLPLKVLSFSLVLVNISKIWNHSILIVLLKDCSVWVMWRVWSQPLPKLLIWKTKVRPCRICKRVNSPWEISRDNSRVSWSSVQLIISWVWFLVSVIVF